jgi:hypothetical protein
LSQVVVYQRNRPFLSVLNYLETSEEEKLLICYKMERFHAL